MNRLAWMGALLAAATVLATPTLAFAQNDSAPGNDKPGYHDLRRVTQISGDAARGQSRSELCAACHGPAGISIVPIYPDIAGQRADYMYWQLVGFKNGDTVMAPVVAELGDQDMRDLAVYYAGFPAAGPPADPSEEAATESEAGPDPALLARGEQLYLHGDPSAGIPPCQACHGEDARGHPKASEVDAAGYTPYAVYPSLRGQREAYLASRIGEYQQGKHTRLTTGFVMTGVVQNLDQASVEALAAWLSSLPR